MSKQKEINELIVENKMVVMKAIKQIVERERLKQREVAELLDIKQPRASDLICCKHDLFSLEILMGYLDRLGHKIVFEHVQTVKGKPVKAQVLNKRVSFRTIFA
ncbi:XRE family transcriptional regulator [Vibrio parahaemolyticus]|nr:XRE family transcriptional regulator [Vibrio parahaemolyticus]EJR2787894.1 XRE family transcriptional regulator [Vibrio parahaemolyticus]